MIDTTVFVYEGSIWQDIFVHLKKYGFDVYSPSTKVGECEKPYIVLKNNGSTRHEYATSDIDIYSIMCYVPKEQYSKLEPMVQKVKKCMKDLLPLVYPYGTQTPSYYDDTYKAHMVSVEYKNYKKI